MPIDVRALSKQQKKKTKVGEEPSDTNKPALKRMRLVLTPSPALVASVLEIGGENPPSTDKRASPFAELVGPVIAKPNKELDVPIDNEGPSNLNKSKGPTEKKDADLKKFSPSISYKGKSITADQSAFQSCGVAFNLFTYATLPKDKETLHQMSDHDLKRGGFHSLLKVYLYFTCYLLQL